MNKTLVLLALISLLVGSTIVSAVVIDYGARCDITRPATEFRPEKTWYGIGIYGITVEKIGETYYPTMTCFLPSGRHKETCTSKIVTTCDDVEVCEDVDVCKDFCHWEKYCDRWCGWGCNRWCCDWDWHRVCHEVCHTDNVCHIETSCDDVKVRNCK